MEIELIVAGGMMSRCAEYGGGSSLGKPDSRGAIRKGGQCIMRDHLS